MTAAPGPQQPDEVPMRYPVGRPYWLGTGQPSICERCMTSQDSDGPHPCPSVVCSEHGIEHDPDRPAAPSAQPGYERESGPPARDSEGPHNTVIAPSDPPDEVLAGLVHNLTQLCDASADGTLPVAWVRKLLPAQPVRDTTTKEIP